MYRRHTLSLVVALVFCLLSSTARADVIWGTVTHTTPTMSGEVPVLLTAGTIGSFMGGSTYNIQGTTSIGGVTVNISTNNSGSSGTDQLFANTSVQLYANPLGASDTSIDQLTFTASGHTFTDIAMDLFGAFTGSDSVTFMVTTNDGTFTHLFTGLTDNNTDNWFLLTTGNGEVINSVTLTDTRFYALQNLNLSGVAATPEPASLLLMGMGMAGWFAGRKKRSS